MFVTADDTIEYRACCLKEKTLHDDLYVTADGVALGAAASMSKMDVEIIVFIAIMLHKVRWPT